MKKRKKNFNLFGFLLDIFLCFLAFITAIVLYVPFLILFPTKIEGRKNLKQAKRLSKGKIFAINHYSNFDVVLLHVFLFPFSFSRKLLAKAELNKFKFFGRILKGFGAIYINRGKADLRAIQDVNENLQKGKTLIIFPEGTRNKNGEDLQEIKSGTIFFANRAKVPIVPAAFKKKSGLFRFNKIIIGEPYFVENYSKEGVMVEVEKLSTKLKKLREEREKPFGANGEDGLENQFQRKVKTEE